MKKQLKNAINFIWSFACYFSNRLDKMCFPLKEVNKFDHNSMQAEYVIFKKAILSCIRMQATYEVWERIQDFRLRVGHTKEGELYYFKLMTELTQIQDKIQMENKRIENSLLISQN